MGKDIEDMIILLFVIYVLGFEKLNNFLCNSYSIKNIMKKKMKNIE